MHSCRRGLTAQHCAPRVQFWVEGERSRAIDEIVTTVAFWTFCTTDLFHSRNQTLFDREIFAKKIMDVAFQPYFVENKSNSTVEKKRTNLIEGEMPPPDPLSYHHSWMSVVSEIDINPVHVYYRRLNGAHSDVFKSRKLGYIRRKHVAFRCNHFLFSFRQVLYGTPVMRIEIWRRIWEIQSM